MSLHEHRFAGSNYVPQRDNRRLDRQIDRVREAMKDGAWRTLAEIEALTGDPQASISAQLRHLRRERHGSHVLAKRHRGDRSRGLFEYRINC